MSSVHANAIALHPTALSEERERSETDGHYEI